VACATPSPAKAIDADPRDRRCLFCLQDGSGFDHNPADTGRAIMTILAGDLGGTKTVLALYRQGDRIDQPWRSESFASREYTDLDSIVARFLDKAGETPRAAAFGVAGPIIAGKAYITNLKWEIDPERLGQRFGIASIGLLNDLQATAIAVPHLAPEDRCTLSPGIPEPDGLIAVIAAGTGLGMAFLVPGPGGWRAFPTEGGHMSFAPRGDVEADLHAFLRERLGHVSFERICSGIGLPNIYDYLRSSGRHQEPTWLREELDGAADRTPVIVDAALANRAEICTATLDIFVHALAGALGNMSLVLLPMGGVYLGGGIPPRILKRLQQPDFLESIRDKGRFRALLERIPVHVILDAQAALHGAAWHARELANSPRR
jgi:glucokinase